MDVSFANDGFYTEENINTPILVEGVPVGIITNVDDKLVYGIIWDRYLSRRIFANSRKLCDVSIEVK